jgi:hypothetical protein
MKITTGKQALPRRILLYGQHGIGKSTWAASAPSPIFLNVEDGINDLDVARSEHLKELGQVIDAISWLVQNPHEFQTVVVDTIDWLEHLIFHCVAKEASKGNISDIGYGKGYEAAKDKWDFLLRGMDVLRTQRGMMVILLAHAKVTRFENPETDAYDRYDLDLHKSSAGMIQEWCDEVLFASSRVFTRTEELGFGKERKIAVGSGERFIRTTETAAAVAKNRLRLPPELPLDWNEFAKFLPAKPAGMATNNINGVVVNGTSKSEGK